MAKFVKFDDENFKKVVINIDNIWFMHEREWNGKKLTVITFGASPKEWDRISVDGTLEETMNTINAALSED